MRRFSTLTPRVTLGSNLKMSYNVNELINWEVTPPCPIPDHIIKTPYFHDPSGRMPPSQKPSGHKYDAKSIGLIRENAKVVAAARLLAIECSQVGVSTDQVDRMVTDYMVHRGVCPAGINFWNFPKTLCASVNQIVCHGVPNTRPLRKGDVVTYDVTCWSKGFFGDNAACLLVGDDSSNPYPRLRHMVEQVKVSVEQAGAKVGPGVSLLAIAEEVTRVADAGGFGLCGAFSGHFIGEEMHMHPTVPAVVPPLGSEYRQALSRFKLEPGHVFTIEPIFLEKDSARAHEVKTLDDGWSSCTVDGAVGCQWENMFAVTEDGVEVLNSLSEEEVAKLPFNQVREYAEWCKDANKELIKMQNERDTDVGK